MLLALFSPVQGGGRWEARSSCFCAQVYIVSIGSIVQVRKQLSGNRRQHQSDQCLVSDQHSDRALAGEQILGWWTADGGEKVIKEASLTIGNCGAIHERQRSDHALPDGRLSTDFQVILKYKRQWSHQPLTGRQMHKLCMTYIHSVWRI